jgi:hypothetical protein
MGSHDHSHPKLSPSKGDIRTIKESAAGSCLRMGSDLIRRESQTSLDLRQIKQAVIFATGEKAQTATCHIGYHREIPILTIESKDDSSKRNVLFGSIPSDDPQSTEQFPTIISVACISIGSEPLVRVS